MSSFLRGHPRPAQRAPRVAHAAGDALPRGRPDTHATGRGNVGPVTAIVGPRLFGMLAVAALVVVGSGFVAPDDAVSGESGRGAAGHVAPERERGSLSLAAADEGVLPDPYRPQQWHLDRLGLDGDKPLPTGTGQVVAIVDSGVDLAHPDLVDAILRDDRGDVVGWDWVDDDAHPDDEFGHGTMVAGVVAATTGNGIGGAGVAPDAEIMPLRVLDERGEGPTADIAEAIDFARVQGATVINLSLESATTFGVEQVPAVIAAIDRAVSAGVVVVTAAGNRGAPLADFSPGLGVVVVGATDRDDMRAGFSDGGRTDLLMAPGIEIVSTWCRPTGALVCDGTTHNQGVADGTSFAAPQVAGIVALLRSAGLTGPEAVERLRATAIDIGEPGPDPATGFGLVTASGALRGWPNPIPVPSPAPEVALSDAALPVIPGEVVPDEIVVAESPRSLRIVVWSMVIAITLAIAIVTHGVATQRRIRVAGTMPSLDGGAAGDGSTMRPGVTLVGHPTPMSNRESARADASDSADASETVASHDGEDATNGSRPQPADGGDAGEHGDAGAT